MIFRRTVRAYVRARPRMNPGVNSKVLPLPTASCVNSLPSGFTTNPALSSGSLNESSAVHYEPLIGKELNEIDKMSKDVIDSLFNEVPKPKKSQPQRIKVDLSRPIANQEYPGRLLRQVKRQPEEPVKWKKIEVEQTMALEKTNVMDLYAMGHEFEPLAGAADASWYEGAVFNAPMLGDDKIPKWLKNVDRALERTIDAPIAEETDKDPPSGRISLKEVLLTLERLQGQDIKVIDVGMKCQHAKYQVLVTGRSERQIYSLADSIRILAKHRVSASHSMYHSLRIEGYSSEDWMVVDLGDIIVHSFTPEARASLDLEGLWEGMDPNNPLDTTLLQFEQLQIN